MGHPVVPVSPYIEIFKYRVNTYITYFCRIQDEGGSFDCSFENGQKNISKLYIVTKGIYRRLRFYLNIWRIVRFRDFMSNFHEVAESRLSEKFKLLECERVINHIKAAVSNILFFLISLFNGQLYIFRKS